MATATRAKTYLSVLVVLGSTHLSNDLMQSLIPASYPILKETYGLDFVQIGMITLTFQIAGAGHGNRQIPSALFACRWHDVYPFRAGQPRLCSELFDDSRLSRADRYRLINFPSGGDTDGTLRGRR
jgi:hypothetical protein